VVYEEEKEPIETKEGTWLSIDLGLDNLAACVDHSGRSFILDGRLLKSYNRWFNKEVARLQSIKDKQGIEGNTERINKLFRDRNNYVHDYLNKATKAIVDYCKANKIEKVFCGDSGGWKQEIDLGDSTNEKFVQVPFDWFKQKLKYKLEFYGIEFMLVDESYTSKCNGLADTEVKKKQSYGGKRIRRGLYKTSDGTLINADVNSALNIARKGMSETNLGVGSSGVVDTPRRIRKPFGLRCGSNINKSLIQTSPEAPS
ncbi:transposase, partial [archaeon SCG-AAA382B04]